MLNINKLLNTENKFQRRFKCKKESLMYFIKARLAWWVTGRQNHLRLDGGREVVFTLVVTVLSFHYSQLIILIIRHKAWQLPIAHEESICVLCLTLLVWQRQRWKSKWWRKSCFNSGKVKFNIGWTFCFKKKKAILTSNLL